MELRITDGEYEYVLGHFGPRAGEVRLFREVPPEVAVHCIRRWLSDEPRRTHVRHFLAEALPFPNMYQVSDEALVEHVGHHGHLRIHRRRHSRAHGHHHHKSNRANQSADADSNTFENLFGSSEDAVQPCDFDKVSIKCSHMPDPRGNRTLKEATFSKEFGIQISDLPPPKNRKHRFKQYLEVTASRMKPDPVKIDILGGPGYTCRNHHPKVTIVDSANETLEFHGKTHVQFDAVPRIPDPRHLAGPWELICHHFLQTDLINTYNIAVDTCGIRQTTSNLGTLSQKIVVYPSEWYDLSLQIPPFATRTMTFDSHAESDGAVVRSTSTEKGSWKGTTKRGHEHRLEHSGSLLNRRETDTETAEAKNADDGPVLATASSFSFTRNGDAVDGSVALGQIVHDIISIARHIEKLEALIQHYEPQIGFKATFDLKLFQGSLDFSWGFEEWADQTVFKHWKLDAKLTLISFNAEISFGVSFGISIFRVELLIFGSIAGELPLDAGAEATPDAPLWEFGAGVTLTGKLGLRAELGPKWAAAEVALVAQMPFTAMCSCSADQPFHVDWSLDFKGIMLVVSLPSKWFGIHYHDPITILDGWPEPKKGRFPSAPPA